MNNNRGNNRRRGRNNRSQGGQQLNRIDSRARGNAPQLLDKYKKLAEDAHRNGDRVQAEYYLQFADHYFRVIADSRPRQDENRQRRDSQRDDNDANADDGDEREVRDDGDDGEGERGSERAERNDRSRNDGPDVNPFTRDNRQRRPRRRPDTDTEEAVENDGGLDPSALPPAIGENDGAEKPKRTRRPRKPKDEDSEMPKAVNG